MNNSVSTLERLGSLSKDKAKLLELLLQQGPDGGGIVSQPREHAAGNALRAPAAEVQQRLWFIDQLEGGSAAYHIPLTLRLRGELDTQALRRALDCIVERHEALRTVFKKVEGELVQEIALGGSFALVQVDVSGAADREEQVLRHSREELLTAFDLSVGPLARGRLLRLGADEHALLITMHHMVSDGWSLEVFVRELGVLYEAYRAGRTSPLVALPIQYADYAHWQRQSMGKSQLQEQLGYWKEHLQGAPELLELPTDRPRPAVQSYRGASVQLALGVELTGELKALSRRCNLTLAMTLHCAWSILLSRLSGQQDIVVGMPVANRRRTELEGLIGFFVNTLAVRVRLEDDPSVLDLLERVKQIMVGAYAHQEVPFEKVVEALQPVRSLSHSPIFQVMFTLHNVPAGVIELPGLTLARQEVPLHTAQFDLSLSLQESAQGLMGTLGYASDLFDAQTVQRWAQCFERVLHEMVREPQCRVSKLALLGPAQRRELIELFNATQADYPQHKLIQQLFEEQVRRTPHSVAVVYEGQSLTYAQLNARANQLARYLITQGVGADRLVGICVDRSLEMVVGLLGILKAGGAYVPLDPSYPAERLAYMLQDAAPQAVLIQESLRERLPPTDAVIAALDSQWDLIAQHPAHDTDPSEIGLCSHHLAYVIYTSGSTGKPKGVMIEHASVLNLQAGLEDCYRGAQCSRVALNASFNFDASVQQFAQLLTGRTLILIPQSVRQDPDQLLTFLREHRIDGIDCTPSQLRSWIAAGLLEDAASALRVVLVGGEPIEPELWTVLAQCPEVSFYNVYGPTECTVDATLAALRGDRGPAHIGRPMKNRRVYIVDRHEQLVPVGVTGELYIGGAGIARGYLCRSELTAERFRVNCFAADGGRLYKTGDLARWRANGTIEYLGRNDQQVKVRGFRIELGEIESQLVLHPQIHEGVVLAREDVPGEKRLVAYFVPTRAEPPVSVESLRSHLKASLPEYMIPTAFVSIERMPLTPSGKLDRRALPAPELDAYASRRYEPPSGDVEEILAGIWQGLLRIERVGRHDNFFELGGHSLLIVHMMERLRRFGLSAELRRVFESPSLADLAKALTRSSAQAEVPPNLIPAGCAAVTPQMLTLVELTREQLVRIEQAVPGGAANIQDIYPLAPLQEGILFHSVLDERRGDTYVVPTLLAIDSREKLDQLIASLQMIIDRYGVLRTAVLWQHLPRPLQVVWRKAALPVDELALDENRNVEEQLREWLRPERQRLDLRTAPLLRLRIAPDLGTGRWYALLQLHHVTIDHVTIEIITSEVVACLKGINDQPPPAPAYRNHVARALSYARTHAAETFFKAKLHDIDEPAAPFGRLDVRRDGSQVEEASQDLDLALARRIRIQARRSAVSAATLFHAAWALVVAKTSAREDVVFGTVLLGRLQGDAGAQRMLGMFINTLPVRLRLQGVTVKELVEQTQRELVELLQHEQASLAVAQACSGIAGGAPLFTALLNYRHTVPNPAARWDGAPGIRVVAWRERTNYPIVVSVDDFGEGFSLTAQTDQGIEPSRVTAYLHLAVQALVSALEEAPQTPALALEMLAADERAQVLNSFNATQTSYPRDQLIHELFEQQARRTPNAVAVIWESTTLTYAQLNEAANQLAFYLRSVGVAPGEYVPVLMPRCLRLLIAQLAVLKCGAAYVPLDPEFPTPRCVFTIQDCNARRVVTDADSAAGVSVEGVDWINYDAIASVISGQPKTDLRLRFDSPPPAYVMYTSGSTGVPKGVIVAHHAVNRLAINNGYADIGPDDCIPHYSNPAFDASTFEIWGALLNGARIVIVPQPVVFDAARFLELLDRQRVTLLWMTVGLFNQYAQALAPLFRKLRYLIVGGDSLDPGTVRRVLRNSPPRRFLNAYGPTECTTFSTTHLIESVDPDTNAIPIGRPIANARIYILDAQSKPVPVGVQGELYIGGHGVALGYLHRPELTMQRFLPDPFSADAQSRMYRTGDIGRWRADGTIEFLGRNDHQVKIRGFRIELGEIEAQLARVPCVEQAVVTAWPDTNGQKRLVAYVVAAKGAAAVVEQLRTQLRTTLPEYMVPGAFVLLERIPLSSTGKVDRRALPSPDHAAFTDRTYEAPQGDVERTLADIWRELLQVDRIGRHDQFFDLGGHSLLALRALTRINEALGSSLNITDLYRSGTVYELAAHIGGRAKAAQEELIDLCREAALEPDIRAQPCPPLTATRAILMTGASGFVGRFLLAELLNHSHATAKIYCLVRQPTQRQAVAHLRGTLKKWDLWRDEWEDRVVAVTGDLRSARLGMDDATYSELSQSIDSIYNCGTSMNHLETYAMARSANVGSAKELLRFAMRERPKLINHISSISVFSAHGHASTRTVDETSSTDDEKHPAANGYAASKWVGEKIFVMARERGIACNVFRLGLVWADTQQGRYDELQREYRIFKTCLISGYGIKDYCPPVPLTPVDYVARAVRCLGERHPNGQGTFHVSANRQDIAGMFERCNRLAGTSLELLPYYEWICAIKELYQRGCSLPAVPLLESAFSLDCDRFKEHQRRAQVTRVQVDCSRTHRELEAVGVTAPVVDDNLLKLFVETLIERDCDLSDWWTGRVESETGGKLAGATRYAAPRGDERFGRAMFRSG